MPTTLTNGIQLPDKGSVDWYNSMQSNYNLIDTHLGNTDTHVTAEDKANWNSKQGSLSQAQLDAIAQVATNTSDITALQSGKANVSHTHSSSDITDIGDYATKQYVDNSISGLVDNAPDALNTLNELSAALNDDSNFASTVTTALGAKANSADLATVATTGSYNDLSNKPTINDSTITIQKNGSTVDTFTTNGSAKTINIPVPTKTSDLTNDSNFVDTSNSAVASGITSAKVTSYDSHVADTDIHVTTADKTKWNNGVSQSYVLRYSSSSVTDNSTIAFSTLDNTDNIKSGDKVIDVDGKIFSIVSVDTANQTVTVGTALIDLALDANVVHTSGNETVGGNKTFTGEITNNISNKANAYITLKNSSYDPKTNGQSNANSSSFSIGFNTLTDDSFAYISAYGLPEYSMLRLTTTYFTDSENSITDSIEYRIYQNGDRSLRPRNNNNCLLGETSRRWKSVYATNYYYGSDNTEFSTKFITSDTAQTITGSKTFSSNTLIYNSDNTATTPNLYLKSSKIEVSAQGNTSGDQNLTYLDKNNTAYAYIKGVIQSNGSAVKIRAIAKDSSDNSVVNELQMLAYTNGNKAIFPSYSNEVDLGVSSYKWKSFNGVEPSSLGMPDLSNGIDISSYLDTSQSSRNYYTPSVNGWISIKGRSSSGLIGIAIIQGDFAQSSYNLIDFGSSDKVTFCALPVKAGVQVEIWLKSITTLDSAKFFPCQGNV